ncbi:hypothetical protein G9A89_009680 [Geosiphon pyriformis]|nr:hypothetical protein G9A89_009680 [Geosiphon pyriformis]
MKKPITTHSSQSPLNPHLYPFTTVPPTAAERASRERGLETNHRSKVEIIDHSTIATKKYDLTRL